MLNKIQNEFEKTRIEIIERLNKEGIRVSKGNKNPRKGHYSGLIGRKEEVLQLNISEFEV